MCTYVRRIKRGGVSRVLFLYQSIVTQCYCEIVSPTSLILYFV